MRLATGLGLDLIEKSLITALSYTGLEQSPREGEEGTSNG